MAETAYAYLLLCSDNSLYAGWTNDPEKRLKAHNSGKGSKYTRSRLPVKFALLERFDNKIDAMKHEAALKK
ncbi:MAG: GIY-YIG nuclease family protein, partial [Oscillospiraceae bacterium]|nr:GIY-YIG nuclease family protein [Oscillospiraceae bacterium]